MEYKKIATEKLKFNIVTSSSAGIDHATNELKHAINFCAKNTEVAA